nr:ABC transporter permease [bacterium]
MDANFWVGLIAAMLAAGTGLLLATMGEIIAEKSGILNLGVEGMMLLGAFCGFAAMQATGSPWVGALCGMLAGGALALLHAFITITLRASQVVSGLALTMLGTGLAAVLGGKYVGVLPVKLFEVWAIPGLSDIPYIGPALFEQKPLVYITLLLAVVLSIVMHRTKLGLMVRAAGENPAATDAAGVPVFTIRYLCTVLGGMLAGLGGAYLTLSYNGTWTESVTGGQGWIAVALVIFASWKPLRACFGAYLFGAITILGYRLQAAGINVSLTLFQMLPYLATIVILILTTAQFKGLKRFGAPQGLGVAYDREAR